MQHHRVVRDATLMTVITAIIIMIQEVVVLIVDAVTDVQPVDAAVAEVVAINQNNKTDHPELKIL